MSAPWVKVADLTSAYEAGGVDPLGIAEASLAAVERCQASEPALDAFVALASDEARAAAAASAARYQKGKRLGPLDGVPVVIKDMVDLKGFATTDGTSYRKAIASSDAEVVRRLKRAGAVIIGKTALHEIGLGGTGINPGHVTARNPWDRTRVTGGSSSGTGAAVGAGIVPVGLGSDAGGSIRIPAAFCGLAGLKPTFGRVPASGGALLCWSLDHLGPLGTCVQDLAAFYAATAGPDAGDDASLLQPPVDPIAAGVLADLSSLRVAWSPEFADDADDEVRASFHASLDALRGAGAQVEAVKVAWIKQVRPVGFLTMGAEAASSQRDWLREHRRDYGPDTRLLLAMGETVSAVEYLHAQRVRTLIRRGFEEVLRRFDVFVSPTTACVAPMITEAAISTGEVDDHINSAIARYTFAANLTGFPTTSLPGPVPPGALPVGLQLMSLPWTEDRLLAISAAVEALLPTAATAPGYIDLLADVGLR